MRAWLAARWQMLLVALLFVASLAALVVNTVPGLTLPGRELEARDRLRSAATALAEAAVPLQDALAGRAGPGGSLPEPINRKLAALAGHVLAGYRDVEGGFYLRAGNQFAGSAHPHGPPRPRGPARREPPPLESSAIRSLARDALARPAGEPPLVEVHDIGPSRVALAALAIGEDRPAPAAVWVMVRVVNPEQQRQQLRRSQVSAVLGLAGIVTALALTASQARRLRNARRQQERLRDELRQAEHLAGLGRLLAGVAHEVRNPLAGIRSTVQLWQRLPDEARTPQSLEAVVRAVDRLNELVSRLLLFARSGHEQRRPVDLNALVVETFELLRARAGEQDVSLQADLAPALPAVPGAGQALRQVLLNLAGNALQAMPGGGTLTARTRATPEGLELTVADTGPGVAVEDRAHLFEPFHTTRPDGTGLGLALCREIVEQHGGHIELTTAVGEPGATFRVRLPFGRKEEA